MCPLQCYWFCDQYLSYYWQSAWLKMLFIYFFYWVFSFFFIAWEEMREQRMTSRQKLQKTRPNIEEAQKELQHVLLVNTSQNRVLGEAHEVDFEISLMWLVIRLMGSSLNLNQPQRVNLLVKIVSHIYSFNWPYSQFFVFGLLVSFKNLFEWTNPSII